MAGKVVFSTPLPTALLRGPNSGPIDDGGSYDRRSKVLPSVIAAVGAAGNEQKPRSGDVEPLV